MSDDDRREAEAELLDEEIESLKEQVAAVQRQLQVETSTIISSSPGQQLIKSNTSSSSRARPRRSPRSQNKLLSQAERQEAHIQQCFHRICTPVTAFKVHDPDPNAVDGGHVLGLRFEIMSRAQFLNPYYVMLNRPYLGSSHLRVHRHTLPPAIVLSGFAARYLPPPKADETEEASNQDLDRFVRVLRREIARYHNRLGVSADLRRGLGLHRATEVAQGVNSIAEVGIADIEAKQIRLTWADERTGRLVMDDDGKVVKLMVYRDQVRDWDTTRELQNDSDRIEDVVRQLQEYAEG